MYHRSSHLTIQNNIGLNRPYYEAILILGIKCVFNWNLTELFSANNPDIQYNNAIQILMLQHANLSLYLANKLCYLRVEKVCTKQYTDTRNIIILMKNCKHRCKKPVTTEAYLIEIYLTLGNVHIEKTF